MFDAAARVGARAGELVTASVSCRSLMCQYRAEDVLAAVAKAFEHRLFDVSRLETILLQNIAARDYFLPLASQLREDYEKWPQYQQGATTPEPDLKAYGPALPEDTGTAPEDNPDDRRDP